MADKTSTRMPKQIKAYDVSEVLGRGGMGEVYLATHDLLERPVAIKRYSPAPGVKDDQKNKERFLREGKALAKLQHQGIVGVHDLFEHRGQFFMVLEHVEGYHLGKLLEKGPLPMDVACIIGLKLAEALEHAHFHRIIHRDIKATNVMVSRSGQVKLMDFGIARGALLDKVTQTGLLVGTPRFLAPEVVSGKEANELSDIYGIGTLMYNCLSGRTLFYDAKETNLYQRILAGDFTPLKKVSTGLPRQLRSIVHKCLARKPEKRFKSMSEFRQTLDLFMANQRIWANHAERLSGYMLATDHISKEEATWFDVSNMVIQTSSALVERPPRRLLPWLVIALILAALAAGILWLDVGSIW